MLRSIAWMTLVLSLVVIARIFEQQSFDQTARNLAATSDLRTEVVERSLQAIDANKIEGIRDLTRTGSAHRLGEVGERR